MVTPANPQAWDLAPEAVERVSARVRDAKYFVLPNNEQVGIFGPRLHYEDTPGVWEETDLNFRREGSDDVSDHQFFHTRIIGSGISVTDPQSGVGVHWLTPERPIVIANRAQFSSDGLSWEYRVTRFGIKLETTISVARGPQTYQFLYAMLGGANDFVIDAQGHAQADGFRVGRATIRGADDITYLASPWRLEFGSRLSFDFDDSVLPPEAFPYVIDPSSNFDIAAGGDDGSVQFRDVNPHVWPPTTFFQADAAGTPGGAQRDANGFDEIDVILFRWDTSSLADNAILSEAKFDVHIDDKDDDDARNLTFDWYLFVGTLAEEDYVQEALTDAHTGIDITGITVGVVNSFVMQNETGVSKTGFTGLRGHISGGEPVGKNRVRMRMFEGTPDPRLIITFTVPAPVITDISPNRGSVAGGLNVTITGTNLDNASSVTFGGTEVTSIDGNTPTQIIVTTPAHDAGQVDVVVTTPGGVDTEVDGYTYVGGANTAALLRTQAQTLL